MSQQASHSSIHAFPFTSKNRWEFRGWSTFPSPVYLWSLLMESWRKSKKGKGKRGIGRKDKRKWRREGGCVWWRRERLTEGRKSPKRFVFSPKWQTLKFQFLSSEKWIFWDFWLNFMKIKSHAKNDFFQYYPKNYFCFFPHFGNTRKFQTKWVSNKRKIYSGILKSLLK